MSYGKKVYREYVKGAMGDCDYCINGHYYILSKNDKNMRVKCDKCGKERDVCYD